jgi:hypothetical protein
MMRADFECAEEYKIVEGGLPVRVPSSLTIIGGENDDGLPRSGPCCHFSSPHFLCLYQESLQGQTRTVPNDSVGLV